MDVSLNKKLDTNVIKLITCHGMHRPKADIECLYVKRENGGIIPTKIDLQHNHYRIKEILN